MRFFALVAGVFAGFLMPAAAYTKMMEQERELARPPLKADRRAQRP